LLKERTGGLGKIHHEALLRYAEMNSPWHFGIGEEKYVKKV
jgi:hypothetical protein